VNLNSPSGSEGRRGNFPAKKEKKSWSGGDQSLRGPKARFLGGFRGNIVNRCDSAEGKKSESMTKMRLWSQQAGGRATEGGGGGDMGRKAYHPPRINRLKGRDQDRGKGGGGFRLKR